MRKVTICIECGQLLKRRRVGGTSRRAHMARRDAPQAGWSATCATTDAAHAPFEVSIEEWLRFF